MSRLQEVVEWKKQKLQNELAFLLDIPKAFVTDWVNQRIGEVQQEILNLDADEFVREMTQEDWDREAPKLFKMHGGK